MHARTLIALLIALLAFPAGAQQYVCSGSPGTACTNYGGQQLCPIGQQACNNQLVTLVPPTFQQVCPAGAQYPCVNTGGTPANYQCSPRQCVLRTACYDGADNDGDGKIDWPADPGCAAASDNDEVDGGGGGNPQCADGADNDGDGMTDYPADPGCSSASDTDETNSAAAQCSDGLDNDADGKTDYPLDPGCSSGTDNDETDPRPMQCSDGLDNDLDGKTDYPDEAGCDDRNDDSESPNVVRECNDGKDNDADWTTDYPADTSCAWRSAPSEGVHCTGVNCICGADLDGDGFADQQSEQAVCEQYNNMPLCPYNRQTCNTQTVTVRDEVTGLPRQEVKHVCPSDPNSPCVDKGSGSFQCSPSRCFDRTLITPVTQDPHEDFPQDNGPRDPQGHCTGTVRIFAGAKQRCRKAGTQTYWQNCCDNQLPVLKDTVGARGEQKQPEYREEKSNVEFWSNQCDPQDQESSLLAASNYCIEVGDYCAEKWPFVGCVQRAKAYCCFNSKLAQMIQVQGRQQLPARNSWGTPDNPDCRGFTLEEFQALDFSKIDLSSYYSDLRTEAQPVIEQDARDAAQDDFTGP